MTLGALDNSNFGTNTLRSRIKLIDQNKEVTNEEYEMFIDPESPDVNF